MFCGIFGSKFTWVLRGLGLLGAAFEDGVAGLGLLALVTIAKPFASVVNNFRVGWRRRVGKSQFYGAKDCFTSHRTRADLALLGSKGRIFVLKVRFYRLSHRLINKVVPNLR